MDLAAGAFATEPAQGLPLRAFRTIIGRRETTALVVLVILCVFLSLMNPNFLTVRNLTLVGRSLSFVGIASLGGAVVLSCGQLDLSIGSAMGLAGVFAAYLTVSLDCPAWLVLPCALAVGIVYGLLNGLLIVLLRLDSLIVTLGTGLMGRGAIYVITGGWPIGGFSPTLRQLGIGFVGGIPVSVWIMLALGAIFTWLMSSTAFGWHIYSIGGNEESARLSGVPVDRLKVVAYVVGGLMAAVGGFLLTARLGTGEVSVASGYELDVIAAAVIGGLQFGSGGRGVTSTGILLGVCVMAVLRNALVLLSVPSEYQQIVLGGALLLAMGFERARSTGIVNFGSSRRAKAH
jgi:ribose transport system permease protein